MAELFLMASAAFSPGIFHHEQNTIKSTPKDFHALTPNLEKRHVNITSHKEIDNPQFEYPWKFSSLLPDNQFHGTMPAINKEAIVDEQDTCFDSVLFSSGVAEQYTRHEKIMKFLANGSNITDGNDLKLSLMSDLKEFQTLDDPIDNEFSLYDNEIGGMQKIVCPQNTLYLPQPLLDFVGNLSHNPFITVQLNGQVLFTGIEAEMRNLLSIFEEFNFSNNLSNGSRKASVVPYFTRRRGGHARANPHAGASAFEVQTIAPSKSAERSKTRLQQNIKQNKNTSNERFSKNYFYACDCLLNMYLEKSTDRTTIHKVKDSSFELTQLLSQSSAVIIGTGLAVVFSIALKAMNGAPSLSSPIKLFNVAFGLGLFWFSFAVNKLRDNVHDLGKKSARVKKPIEERMIVEKVKRSMNEIIFRFAALIMVGAFSL